MVTENEAELRGSHVESCGLRPPACRSQTMPLLLHDWRQFTWPHGALLHSFVTARTWETASRVGVTVDCAFRALGTTSSDDGVPSTHAIFIQNMHTFHTIDTHTHTHMQGKSGVCEGSCSLFPVTHVAGGPSLVSVGLCHLGFDEQSDTAS